MKIDNIIFQIDYNLAEKIKISRASDSFLTSQITSRVYAFAISFFCLAAFTAKTAKAACSTLPLLARSIWYQRNEFGKLRDLYIEFFDALRYLSGALLGSVVGIVNPTKARDSFLVLTDDILTRQLNKKEATQLYQTIDMLQEVFATHDIEWRPEGGTVLGIKRHKGIIPWDDDADFFLRPGDEKKLEHKEFKRALHAQGYEIKPAYASIDGKSAPWGFKVYPATGRDYEEFGESYKFPFVDLMISTKIGNRITFQNPLAQIAHPTSYYTQEEWDENKLHTFGPLQIKGPKSFQRYCDTYFGSNWKDMGVQERTHNPDSRFPFKIPRKVKITTLEKGAEYDRSLFEAL